MTVLSSEQRKLLSDVVVRAREVVETACAQRITSLGTAAEKPPAVLTEEERAVRVGLRARARQLGSIDALVAEAGFEHWHRMLFARFLADNGLLVDEESGQPLSMDEVAEYAAETGEPDRWEVAARFAAAMLPGIFSQDDPILGMRLPVETRQELERLLDRLPAEVITAQDSLGWVYQYWQAKRKDEVNKSERKIGGADLAPVTQLFTENYMVRFLLENSIGAWWAARHPNSPLLAEWEYLRRDGADGFPKPGGFDGWPTHVAEVTVMDPCCGSGHFLTAAFGMLWRMRAEDEGLSPVAAQDAVIRDNLYGLELDPRCTQMAAFALALEAWKAGGHRTLPLPNIACSGIPAHAPLADWFGLAAGTPLIEAALTRLHTLFVNADTLGSLIDPIRATEEAGLESVDWHEVAPLVREALSAETGRHSTDPAAAVFGQAAAGIARAADYLSRRYTVVATNVPYLGRTAQGTILRTFLVAEHSDGAEELGAAFALRTINLLAPGGVLAQVLPEPVLFLGSLAPFRRRLLELQLRTVALLGPRAFSGISGEVVRASLVVLENSQSVESSAFLIAEASSLDPEGKAKQLQSSEVWSAQAQAQISRTSGARLIAYTGSRSKLLSEYAAVFEGMSTGDGPRYQRRHWELRETSGEWIPFQTAPDNPVLDGGLDTVLLWQKGVGNLSRDEGARIQGLSAWGRRGILIERMVSLRPVRYFGTAFQKKTVAVIPRDAALVPAIWCFCESGRHKEEVLRIDRRIGIATSAIGDVPFDRDYWSAVASDKYPEGLPDASSDDPTQLIFRGEVAGSRFPLQVAMARLLGFRWPDQEPDGLDALADSDGVVCLPALGGESTAMERLRGLLATALGKAWGPQTLDTLLTEAGVKSGAAGLEKWLRDGFFKDHCRVFANRPFIWQVWDGCPDGFSALLNYHKLDRKLLERLTYDYLGSWWIGRLNDDIRRQAPGAEVRLAAAEELKSKLQLILEGEPPYDIYVRWKSPAEQPMGWEPDLDDGVRMNIRPFMTAGVLRTKPNVKWEKDRGKNPDGTERLNDLHYTLADKRAAREGTGL